MAITRVVRALSATAMSSTLILAAAPPSRQIRRDVINGRWKRCKPSPPGNSRKVKVLRLR